MNFEIQPFQIEIFFGGKSYKASVEQTYLSESLERFTVTGGKKSIEVQSNRPLLRKNSLNKKRINWKVINGQIQYQTGLEKVIEAIESYIRHIEHPPFNYKDHPKNSPW